MAVQQNKKSPSKRGMHRSHNALVVPGIAVEPTTGEIHLRHHISPTGFYRGRKVLKTKSEAEFAYRRKARSCIPCSVGLFSFLSVLFSLKTTAKAGLA